MKTQKRPVVFPEHDDGCWKFGLFDKDDQEIGWGTLDPDEDAISFAVLTAMFRAKGLEIRILVHANLTAAEQAALDAAGRES